MIQQIEKIIKIFETANISKLELEVDNIKLKLEKNETAFSTKQTTDLVNNNSVMQSNDNKYITSPVVGTFYAQRSEKSKPFVILGTNVKKGDVVCIVEAMKVMNEVIASEDGVITEVLVQNEELVQFGQKLFTIGTQ